MYMLTTYCEETLEGWRFSATLYSRYDDGSVVAVACHGPLERKADRGQSEDLASLLSAQERYISLLQYGARVDGTIGEQLLF